MAAFGVAAAENLGGFGVAGAAAKTGVTPEQKKKGGKGKNKASVSSFFFFNFCIAPALLAIIVLILGATLAKSEGWSLLNGVLSHVCPSQQSLPN